MIFYQEAKDGLPSYHEAQDMPTYLEVEGISDMYQAPDLSVSTDFGQPAEDLL